MTAKPSLPCARWLDCEPAADEARFAVPGGPRGRSAASASSPEQPEPEVLSGGDVECGQSDLVPTVRVGSQQPRLSIRLADRQRVHVMRLAIIVSQPDSRARRRCRRQGWGERAHRVHAGQPAFDSIPRQLDRDRAGASGARAYRGCRRRNDRDGAANGSDLHTIRHSSTLTFGSDRWRSPVQPTGLRTTAATLGAARRGWPPPANGPVRPRTGPPPKSGPRTAPGPDAHGEASAAANARRPPAR